MTLVDGVQKNEYSQKEGVFIDIFNELWQALDIMGL